MSEFDNFEIQINGKNAIEKSKNFSYEQEELIKYSNQIIALIKQIREESQNKKMSFNYLLSVFSAENSVLDGFIAIHNLLYPNFESKNLKTNINKKSNYFEFNLASSERESYIEDLLNKNNLSNIKTQNINDFYLNNNSSSKERLEILI